ncbi:MAG: cell envelope integrity protein TolA [Candidatus Melainabacteria bacterium]|nr:cell envelope integrity protein TolA [Candidatus Melainabacteria bacterium]
MKRIHLHTAFLITCLWFSTAAANAQSAMLPEVIKEYKAGNYEKAVALLTEDLKNNPDDGVTHYYLGMVKKKMGDDAYALDELEWAARLCPPEMIQGLASQALNDKSDALPKVPKIIRPGSDWFSMFGNSVSQVFGAPKAQPQVTAEGDIMMPPPVMFSSMDDLLKNGKKLVKGGFDKAKKAHAGGQYYKSWAATTIPMDDVMDLVDKSKSLNASKWGSHSDGLSKFRQSPESTSDWDYWIQRFTRAFQHVLTSHLYQDAKNQVTGRAACVFSIDRRGNLRGHIYASTGDGVLNSALMKTIQSMNHSRILEFPPTSKIAGFNFTMRWDYGKILKYIAAYKQYQAAREKKALEEIIAKQTEALLLKAKEVAADKAKAEKLKALREKQLARAKAKLLQLNQVKTDVVGQVLIPARPAELQAVALSIGDPNIKKMPSPKAGQEIDPFKNFSDEQIMSWPDLSR